MCISEDNITYFAGESANDSKGSYPPPAQDNQLMALQNQLTTQISRIDSVDERLDRILNMLLSPQGQSSAQEQVQERHQDSPVRLIGDGSCGSQGPSHS